MMDHPDLAVIEPPAEPATAAPARAAAPRFEFTGSGAEYFRIWIVNLLLSVATLGIYSAWAKTRRLQYFYRNTRLDEASFDFVGNPLAILRGRIVAVVLLAAWQYAFGFSKVAGIVTVCLLVVALPFMVRAALRFRLSNTLYRGLPFGFDGSVKGAYLAYLPLVAVLVLPGALVAAMPGKPLALSAFLLYLAWPLIHAAMKRYQHRHLVYGDQRATCTVSLWRLAAPYLHLLGLLVGLFIVLIVIGVVVAVVARASHMDGSKSTLAVVGGLSGLALFYLALLAGSLYVMVRMDNCAWSATAFPGVGIRSDMKARGYLRVQAVNVILTLLTLGLFRPFAAVRTWRYRLEHLHLDAPAGLEQATLHAARPTGALGDSTADLFGIDISW